MCEVRWAFFEARSMQRGEVGGIGSHERAGVRGEDPAGRVQEVIVDRGGPCRRSSWRRHGVRKFRSWGAQVAAFEIDLHLTMSDPQPSGKQRRHLCTFSSDITVRVKLCFLKAGRMSAKASLQPALGTRYETNVVLERRQIRERGDGYSDILETRRIRGVLARESGVTFAVSGAQAMGSPRRGRGFMLFCRLSSSCISHLGYQVPLPNTFPFPYSYWSSDWDVASPPGYVVAFGAIVVPVRLEATGSGSDKVSGWVHDKASGWVHDKASGWVHRLEPAGHSRHQLQRVGGRHRDMGRYQGQVPADRTGRTLEAVKVVEQQERKS